jgi:hypothetical protein
MRQTDYQDDVSTISTVQLKGQTMNTFVVFPNDLQCGFDYGRVYWNHDTDKSPYVVVLGNSKTRDDAEIAITDNHPSGYIVRLDCFLPRFERDSFLRVIPASEFEKLPIDLVTGNHWFA